MAIESYKLVFSNVTAEEADEAFYFHVALAGTDVHLWPRDLSEVAEFAANGELFGVRRSDTGEFVGLCYIKLDEEAGGKWELGGLTVAKDHQGQGIGLFMVNMALSHTLAFQRPLHADQPIVACVHLENQSPRKLLASAGFFSDGQRVIAPGNEAPESMKRNADGNVEGDLYHFEPAHVRALAEWVEEFDGTIGERPAEVQLGAFQDLDMIRMAIIETAGAVESGTLVFSRTPSKKGVKARAR